MSRSWISVVATGWPAPAGFVGRLSSVVRSGRIRIILALFGAIGFTFTIWAASLRGKGLGLAFGLAFVGILIASFVDTTPTAVFQPVVPGELPHKPTIVGAGPAAFCARLGPRLLKRGSVFITGEPGCGKSSLVATAVHEMTESRTKLWFDLEGVAKSAEMGLMLARHFQVPTVAEAISRLARTRNCLVFDHAEGVLAADLSRFEDFVSTLHGSTSHSCVVVVVQGHLAAPTRPSAWEILQPPLLTDDESTELLIGASGRKIVEPDDLLELIQALGGLPRALVLVGRTLARYAEVVENPSLRSFNRDFRVRHAQVVAPGAEPTKSTSLALAIELVLNSPFATSAIRYLISAMTALPDGIAPEMAKAFSNADHVVEANDLVTSYELGLTHRSYAGLAVVPVVGRYLHEEYPDLADENAAIASWTRSACELLAATPDGAWVAANERNILCALAKATDNSSELALALIVNRQLPSGDNDDLLSLRARAACDDKTAALLESRDPRGPCRLLDQRLLTDYYLGSGDALLSITHRLQAVHVVCQSLQAAGFPNPEVGLLGQCDVDAAYGEIDFIGDLWQIPYSLARRDYALGSLKSARQAADQLSSRKMMEVALSAAEFSVFGSPSSSAELIAEVVDSAMAAGEELLLAQALLLGSLHTMGEQPKTDLSRAIGIFEAAGRLQQAAHCKKARGLVHIREGRATYALEAALDLANHFGPGSPPSAGPPGQYQALSKLSENWDGMSREDLHVLRAGYFSRAEVDLLAALTIYRDNDDPLGQSNCHSRLGQLGLQRRDPSVSEHFEAALDGYRGLRLDRAAANALHGLAAAHPRGSSKAETARGEAVRLYRSAGQDRWADELSG